MSPIEVARGPQRSSTAAERVREIVRRCEELHDDLSYQAVRRWKEANPGRPAIGYLPVYIPREVVHAVGGLPVGILGGSDRLEIVQGDSCFQSYICHLPRSVMELAKTGRLDLFDGFIFPSICDVIRNLSGIFQLHFPGRFIHYLDLPQNLDRSLGGEFYRGEMRRIAAGIAELTGIELTDERLSAAIETFDENRRAVADLVALRRESPWFVPTTEHYLLLGAGFILPVEEHTALVREYISLAPERDSPRFDNIRVVVRGAFCEQPPLGLLRTLERAGCDVVDDDFLLGSRLVPDPIGPSDDPLGELAAAFIERALPAAFIFDREGKRGARLVERIREVGADGVILMAPSFCDPALLDQPMLASALDEAGIPYTTFKYSEDSGQFQVIREQAGTFADTIKLWGTA